MSLLKSAFSIFGEALFPVPPAEREVLAMGGRSAFTDLVRAERSPIPEACSIFSYKDERVWRLIWSIKYKKSAAGVAVASYALHQILKSYAEIMPRILIVPMPITSRRRRERGFNQCELLADEIERLHAGCVEENNIGQLIIARDLLVRKLHRSRQTLKDREERLESAQDIFAVDEDAARRIRSDYSQLSGRPMIASPMIVVIDDVITTGGTIRDAVGTIRRAGFENTWGLSVAH